MATAVQTPTPTRRPPVIANTDQAWHDDRARGIGGSDVASLFNEGYGCERRLAYEKRRIEPDYKRPESEQDLLDSGNWLEDIVAQRFSFKTGLQVRRQPSRVAKNHPHARVNMDRQIIGVDPAHLRSLLDDNHPLAQFLDEEGHGIGPGALECKTMNEWDYKRLAVEGFGRHPHYILQLQHTLAVTGYQWGMFAFLERHWFRFQWFAVQRNEELCQLLLDTCETKWPTLSDPAAPLPDALPSGDKRCKSCLYRKSCRGEAYLAEHADGDLATDYQLVSDPEIVELATDFRDAREQAEQAETVVEEIKKRLKAWMREHQIVKLNADNVLKFCNSFSPGRRTMDSKALEGELKYLRDLAQMDDDRILATLHANRAEGEPATIGSALVQIATRIDNCRKMGEPSYSLKTYSA